MSSMFASAEEVSNTNYMGFAIGLIRSYRLLEYGGKSAFFVILSPLIAILFPKFSVRPSAGELESVSWREI